jgi:DNA-binding Lrp family transcriptional regulator
MANQLDKKDLEILEMLKTHAKWTTHQISKKTLIPVTTVHNRIKKMEAMGIIRGYAAVLDHKKLGKGVSAFILADVKEDGAAGMSDLIEDIGRLKEVEEVFAVTGSTDMIIKVRVDDTDSLNDFILKNLRSMEDIGRTQTFVVLSGNE